MARSRMAREKEKGDKAHISMDAEGRKRVAESSSSDRVPKSRKRKSLASPSPAPRRGAPKNKPRRRKAEEVGKQFALKDPGILDEKEENGKVYYLVTWADDPDTGEVYNPTWEPYNFVTPDVVANWQNRRTPVEQARALDQENNQDRQQPEIIDLTDDTVQDSQAPRPEKRRKISHGPNPIAEEETPEQKPRKVGTVESARFQSVSTVGQKQNPYEIKDSYEEEQELSSAGVGKARVEIPIPDGFDRDAYSKVVTSSQPSQHSHTSQLPRGSESQISASSQLQTPAPRHKYSSLIWDEDIEGTIPDSQEPGSSSYEPSEIQVSKTLSTSPETTGTELNTGAVINTQGTSGGDFSTSRTVDSCDAEPFAEFTQASYVDTGGQSSSVQAEAPSTERDQTQAFAQDSGGNQAQDSGLQEPAAASTGFFRRGVHQTSSPTPRTSSESPFTGAAQALQSGFNPEPSSELSEDINPPHNPSAQQVLNQNSLLNFPTSLDSSRPLVPQPEDPLEKSSTSHNEISSSSPHLPTAEDSLPRPVGSLTEQHIDHPFSQPIPKSVSQVEVSSSVEFGTQVPFHTAENESSHLVLSSPHIRSSPVQNSSVPSPYVSAVESQIQTVNPTSQPESSLEQDIEQLQTVQRHYQPEVAPDRSVSPVERTSQIVSANQALPAAPATPVQTPREDIEQISADKTSESIASSPFPVLNINTQCSLSSLKSQALQSHQIGSTLQQSQESSSSLPSPPFEKIDSSAEQFAQLTSQNRPSTPSPVLQSSESPGEHSSKAPPNQEKPSDRLSPPLQSIEDLEITFKQSQLPGFDPQSNALAPVEPVRAKPAIGISENGSSLKASLIVDLTMDNSPAATPAKADNPVLAKLKVRKAEALARRAAERERERAASASRSLPQSPAPPSPAPQSPALQSTAAKSPVSRSPAPISPGPMAAVAAVEDAGVKANQALPLHQTIEDAVPPAFQPILSPRVSPEVETEADLEVDLPPMSLRILPHGQEEYAVPLPMVSYAQDVYVNAMRTRKSQRYAFLTDEVFDVDLVKDIDSMLEDLDQLCSHQDLIVEDLSTQRMDAIERQAKWAENVSTKCIFLAEFLSLMQTEPKQIAVLVRPGRMLEILEALFIWHGFVYNRADRSGYTGNISGGPMQVSLIPTQGEILGFDPPSIVIAFDSSYASVPFLEDLRFDIRFPEKVIPLVQLMVTHSIEHLEKCFHRNLEPVERKIRLVSCLTQIGEGVGKLDHDYLPPPKAARAVAEYVVNGTVEGTWPLLPMPEIEDLKLDVDSSQLRQPSQEETSLSAMPSSNMSVAQASQYGVKRQLIGDDGSRESPKRQRLTPVPGESDPTHVSDTVLQTSSGGALSASAEVSKIIAKPHALDDEQGSKIPLLLKKVNDLEIQLRSREATESELRQMNHDLENRCRDYESSIASIQPKYQEALNDRGHFEHEFNISSLRQANLRKEIENKDAETIKLREQKATLQAELTEARTALSSSSIPEIAEMGKLKEELVKEKSEKERLEKRLKNMQSDLEYMRNNYQNSSTLAAEHASENRALQTELDKLREKDKRDMVRIHEIQSSNEVKEYLRRVQTLKEEKSELERELDKKQEELRAVMNGRRATRGTSVPRSPRMGTGGTMSPGPRSMGRGMQMGTIFMPMTGGNGSRGTSPVPGELGGFRAPSAFMSEALQALLQDNRAPGGIGSRWGNHLQE